MAVTKSGGSSFHGAAFEFHRDDSLNARQWGSKKVSEFNKNNYGANIGGPVKVPFLWSDRVKSYFYFNFEGTSRQAAPVNPRCPFRHSPNVTATSVTGGTPMET